MCGFRPEPQSGNSDAMAMAESMMRHRLMEVYQQGVVAGKKSATQEGSPPRRKRKITPDSPDRHYARPLDSTGLDDHPLSPMAEPHQPDAAIARRYNKRQRISSPDASSTRSASASSASSSVPPVPAVRPGPPLSAQQEGILKDILAGKSVFVTGSAGTGKSVLIRAIIWEFAHRARQRRVREKAGEKVSKETWLLGVTSSTGLSALNIGGGTIHSWAGIGICDQPIGTYVTRVQRFAPLRNRWKQSQALILDEISMVDGRMLEMLDQLGRRIRGSPTPFGGLQMIICGDFLQLPPVWKSGQVDKRFAFQTDVWDELFPRHAHHSLQQVFRQTDHTFIRILEELRKGNVRSESVKALQKLDRLNMYVDGRAPTELFSLNAEVDLLNEENLSRLPARREVYDAEDVAGNKENGYALTLEDATKYLNQNTRWPETVSLKIGATVMLVLNCPDIDLANGSCGTSTSCKRANRAGRIIDMLTQEEAEKAGIIAVGSSIGRPDLKCPVVRFTPNEHARVAAPAKVWVPVLANRLENPNKTLLAERRQIPLVLAWAMTMHKAQGQSMDRVKIDAGNVSQRGQLYVALSRATSLDGLELHNFDAQKVQANRSVIDWMKGKGLLP